MESAVQHISWWDVSWAFLPACLVLGLLYRWGLNVHDSLLAIARMLLQLVLIGFVLTSIFQVDDWGIVCLVLLIMLMAASWIALRPLQHTTPRLYMHAFAAIFVSGILTLGLVTQMVLSLEPWFLPRYMVPLAGMIFAGAMNAVSLAAERFESERERHAPYVEARNIGLHAAMIPLTNMLLAVGLVSLPGMMTGQILSGVSPLIAVKYQIVVMGMIFGASGLSAALYLTLAQHGEGPSHNGKGDS